MKQKRRRSKAIIYPKEAVLIIRAHIRTTHNNIKKIVDLVISQLESNKKGKQKK